MNKKKIIDYTQFEPTRNDLEVIGAFNPAVAKLGEKTVMLLRVAERAKQDKEGYFRIPRYEDGKGFDFIELPVCDDYDFSDVRVVKGKGEFYLTSLSHFKVGFSDDGVSFDFSQGITVMPSGIYEEFGIEDARITEIDGTYFVTYTAVSRYGIHVAMMTTKDFIDFERSGNILPADNKDCVIFPDKINGKYYMLHRPSLDNYGRLNVFTATSNDLFGWGDHRVLENAYPEFGDIERIGAGAVPFLTKKGYLAVYHCAFRDGKYTLIAMLLDKNDPTRVLAKSASPLLQCSEDFEKSGFMEDVVFTCGLVKEAETLNIYYGVCDQCVAVANISLQEVWDNMEVV